MLFKVNCAPPKLIFEIDYKRISQTQGWMDDSEMKKNHLEIESDVVGFLLMTEKKFFGDKWFFLSLVKFFQIRCKFLHFGLLSR